MTSEQRSSLVLAFARVLYVNGQATEQTVAAAEQLGRILGMRAKVMPRWGELQLQWLLFRSVSRCFTQCGFVWVFGVRAPGLIHAVSRCATELGSKMVANRSAAVLPQIKTGDR
jgi:hypothetical protein